ncbi:MAG TPA: hypothetical protein PKE31_07275 [Pseudomonadota bacterium]|jgi:hypothetical protein|nr:hypothetical protein [Pseudomonadota bacterium]
MKRRQSLFFQVCLLVCISLSFLGRAFAADRILAVYLPGVFFSQIERKLDLGSEVATHLAKRLGEKHHYRPQVYVTAEAMEADSARIAVLLVESPYVASHLDKLLPVVVADSGRGTHTRLTLLAMPQVKSLADLKHGGLVFASPMPSAKLFLEHFVFEGELKPLEGVVTPARDVGSALSLLSLHKAEAVLLYEESVASARGGGLRGLYRSDKLPRPTLALTSRNTDPAEVQKMRDAMSLFKGVAHPDLPAFRPTTDQPYQLLKDKMQHKPRRIPMLLDVAEENPPLPTPLQKAASPVQVGLSVFSPD